MTGEGRTYSVLVYPLDVEQIAGPDLQPLPCRCGQPPTHWVRISVSSGDRPDLVIVACDEHIGAVRMECEARILDITAVG